MRVEAGTTPASQNYHFSPHASVSYVGPYVLDIGCFYVDHNPAIGGQAASQQAFVTDDASLMTNIPSLWVGAASELEFYTFVNPVSTVSWCPAVTNTPIMANDIGSVYPT